MKNNFLKHGLIHFIGIGGIGMSGIAELMHDLGYKIQGSDKNFNLNVKRIQKKGIKIFIGHNKKNIKKTNAIVFSSAIKKSNPEIKEAIKKRIPVVSRAEMLSELMRFKKGIAVAGSHGKTTTTSILGSILELAKFDPTIVNGGIINSLSSNSRMGYGNWIVAEADESDGSFLHLPHEIGIITNIDYEHIEHYKNFKNLKNSFKKFALNIPFYGSSIICLENINSKNLAKSITTRDIITYFIDKDYADINITKIKYINNKSQFKIRLSNKFKKRIKFNKNTIDFDLNLLGKHNILNASAAIAATLRIGINISVIKKTLDDFKGVQRRFTLIKEIYNTKIYDDYAHHPNEISATLEIAKNLRKNKIIVIFQPHRFSRTIDLYNDFIKILSKIDVLILTKIYPAGEKNIKGINKKLFNDLRKVKKNVIKVENEYEIYKATKPFMNKNNIIIFMGAGSITNWAKNFILKY